MSLEYLSGYVLETLHYKYPITGNVLKYKYPITGNVLKYPITGNVLKYKYPVIGNVLKYKYPITGNVPKYKYPITGNVQKYKYPITGNVLKYKYPITVSPSPGKTGTNLTEHRSKNLVKTNDLGPPPHVPGYPPSPPPFRRPPTPQNTGLGCRDEYHLNVICDMAEDTESSASRGHRTDRCPLYICPSHQVIRKDGMVGWEEEEEE
ncbi:hypothetical protein Btru_041862 [Bulinus truncatus]|nr:hypothetical protein Btru_041862 [Bulinus truncatus]